MSEPVSLVMGANGFLGSHVARQLVAANQPTKAFIRRTADTRSIDDLALPKFYGDVMDKDSLRAALLCLLYTSPSPRDAHESRMPSSA